MNRRLSRDQDFFRPSALIFAPLAWLKLQFLCHAGDTEVGGFGISARHNLLYIEDVVTVRQHAAPALVRFDDDAVADFFDRSVDAGLEPQQIGRVWIHTHPGSSAEPSGLDEETFHRVFGGCDWAVMFILSRTGQTYARLAFQAGPGGNVLLPVGIDWAAWPACVEGYGPSLDGEVMSWQEEYDANVFALPTRLERARQIADDRSLAFDPTDNPPGWMHPELDAGWESFWEERHEHGDELFAF